MKSTVVCYATAEAMLRTIFQSKQLEKDSQNEYNLEKTKLQPTALAQGPVQARKPNNTCLFQLWFK